MWIQSLVHKIKTEETAETLKLNGSLTWNMVAALVSGMVDVGVMTTDFQHRMNAERNV